MIGRPIKSLKEEFIFYFYYCLLFHGDGNWNWKIGKFVEVNPCGLYTSTDFIWDV